MTKPSIQQCRYFCLAALSLWNVPIRVSLSESTPRLSNSGAPQHTIPECLIDIHAYDECALKYYIGLSEQASLKEILHVAFNASNFIVLAMPNRLSGHLVRYC